MAADNRDDNDIRRRVNQDSLNNLEELNVLLSAMRPEEKRVVVETITIDRLFERLHDSDEKQVELACGILGKILSIMSTKELLDSRQSDLHEGLFHKNRSVKALALKTLVRITENAADSSEAGHRASVIGYKLLIELVSLLTDEDADTLRDCKRILSQVAASDAGLEAVFDEGVVGALKNVMARNEIVRYRVYDFIVQIAKQSEAGFRKCVASNFIAQLVSEIKNDDILIQLNCLEMLAELASSPHGFLHLEDTGILRNLENLFANSESILVASFLQPGLIKFFGSIAHVHPKEVCDRHPVFLNEVCELLRSNNPASIGIAIETVGIVGSSIDGKMALEKLDHLMDKFMDVLVTVFKASNAELQMKALISFERLLHFPGSDPSTELVSLVRAWYDRSPAHVTDHAVRLMKSPFEEVRLAAMRLLRAVARLPWGQTYMNDHPGFVEYLLDRSTECNKEGKETKFEIIKTLAESMTTQSTMGNVLLLRLREYVLQGPFYVQRETVVDVDGSN